MNLPFKAEKISSRLYCGFGIVTFLLTLVAFINYYSSSHLSKRFTYYDDSTLETIAVIEINRDTLELQRNVQLFTFTGYSGATAKVERLSKELFEELEEAKAATHDDNTREILDRMSNHLTGYMDKFAGVIEERHIQQELVENKMTSIAESIEHKLIDFISEHPDTENYASGALRDFYTAKNISLGFFRSPDSIAVKDTKRYLQNASAQLKAAAVTEENKEQVTILKTIIASIESYDAAFIRAVQATRAYLYLVNVVMAGEASEFAYNSNNLKEIGLQQLDVIHDETLEVRQRYQTLAHSISVIAILAGLLCSWLIAQSIVQPLAKITSTFNLLAKGDTEALVPETERHDEIGEMAQAANIFKEKNHETAILLEASQKLTEELNEKSQQLEVSNNEMEQFVYTVSHDLKSPLVTSQGFIGMMRDMASDGEYEEAFKKVDKLERSNKRMNDLISDLLDLSRVGRVELDITELDMAKLLRSIQENFSPKLNAQHATLSIEGELPPLVANKLRVEQLFDNLINNALKYGMNEDKPLIEIGGKDTGDTIEYFVRDHGCGIPPEYQEKVFRLFQRLDNTSEGTGIGLSIVSKIMESHQGKVWVESEVGQGSTFWVSFPKAQIKNKEAINSNREISVAVK